MMSAEVPGSIPGGRTDAPVVKWYDISLPTLLVHATREISLLKLDMYPSYFLRGVFCIAR